MSQTNYYDVLGVQETSNQDTIKKAYRSLAKKHHPDKGGNDETFKKVSEAYDVLGDESKRQQYDHQRRNPFGNNGARGGHNPFEDMFNMFGGNQRRQQSAPEKVIKIMINPIESYNSIDKHITYPRKHMCGDCNGSGGERKPCNVCDGSGVITQRIGTGMFVQMVQSHCNACNGKGYHFIKVCNTCKGSCNIEKNETISVKLPHGVDDGQFLRVHGKGDFHNGIYGNLVIRIEVKNGKDFEKFGDDLIYNKFFDLNELKNDSFIVPHPSGDLSVKMPPVFDTSIPLRVKSKGYNNGELFIKLFVKFTR